MNKNAKYGLIIFIIILALIVSLVYFKNNQKNNTPVLTPQEQASSQADQAKALVAAQVQQAEQAALAFQAAPVAVATKTIKVEFMTDVEKTKLGIATNLKIQILARDGNGTVIAYKAINSDADIVTKFGN